MSFTTTDILNSVRKDFTPELVRNKIKHERLFDKMLELNRFVKHKQGGDQRSALIIDKAGFTGTKMVSGLEQPKRQAQNISKKVTTTRQVLAGDMIITDMEERTLAQQDNLLRDKAKIMHEGALSFIMQDIGSYFLSGTSTGEVFSTANMSDMLTLNGQKATGSLPGTERGLLSFDSVAYQLGTGVASVQGLQRQADIHFNQSVPCGGWSTDGFKAIQEAYLKAQQKDYRFKRGPDIAIADLATYLNILEERRGLVRLKNEGEDTFDKSFWMTGLGQMEITFSTFIDPSNYVPAQKESGEIGTYDPNNGLIMMLPVGYIEWYSLLRSGKMVDISDWKHSEPQRANYCRIDIDGNFLATNLPAFAVVSNTAT